MESAAFADASESARGNSSAIADRAASIRADEVAVGKRAGDLARTQALGRVETESWRLRKDGSAFLASVTMIALFDDRGALRGFGKVFRDIADQTAAQAAIGRREVHLRSILMTVPDAMIGTGSVGVIASFSAAAARDGFVAVGDRPLIDDLRSHAVEAATRTPPGIAA